MRSVHKDLSVINVLDFGVVGDGVVDDTANLQAAFDKAVALGSELWFPSGRYLSSGVVVNGGSSLSVRSSGDVTWEMMPGALSWLHTLDVVHVSIRDIRLDALSAGDGDSNSACVQFETTSSTQGQKDFVFEVENFFAVGKTRLGAGLRARIFESSGDNYTEARKVIFKNISWEQWGTEGRNPINVRGPVRLVKIEDCFFNNGGENGFNAFGDAPAGSSNKAIGLSCEVAFDHLINNAVLQDIEVIQTTGPLFTQMVSNLEVRNLTCTEGGINPYHTSELASFTSDQATNSITSVIPPGFSEPGNIPGPYVQVIGNNLPAPLISGNFYYVLNTDIQLSETPMGAPINLTSDGTGDIRWMGWVFASLIKGDDNKLVSGNASNGGALHKYENVKFTESSPHGSTRSIVYEKSTQTDETANVRLVDSEVDCPVNLAGTGDKSYHGINMCNFYPRLFGVPTTSSPLALDSGIISGCNLSMTSITLQPNGYLTLRDNYIRSRISLVNNLPNTTKLIDNAFDVTDGNLLVDVLAPPAGDDSTLDLFGNRLIGDRSQNVVEFRIVATGSRDLDSLTVFADFNDMSIANFGEADTDAARIVSEHMRGSDSDGQHARTEYPLKTLGGTATPSILGSPVWLSAGNGASYTNFVGDVDFSSVTVYLQAGDSIINGTNISTLLGSDITGPNVVKLIRFDDVWFQV